MKELLLPYAYDSTGNLVHINDAQKGERYTCPICGIELLLKISKIPEGKKYHRTNHFAHSTDNHCSESFLHKWFKNRVMDYIKTKIHNGERNLQFEWKCEKCNEYHIGNLLKRAMKIEKEYDMQFCRPDIALLDKDNKVVIVIEIVVTHDPPTENIQFYSKKKIACLQIKVETFDDCENIEYKLVHPDRVNLCPNPICEKCKHVMNSMRMVTKKVRCSQCHTELRYPILIKRNEYIHWPELFSEEEIKIANEMGANIIKTYKGKKINRCIRCNSYIGSFPTDQPYENEKALGYKCLNCEMNEYIAEKELSYRLNQKIMQNGIKMCPKCGSKLQVRKSTYGYFYGCKNYPKCKYTENIDLD